MDTAPTVQSIRTEEEHNRFQKRLALKELNASTVIPGRNTLHSFVEESHLTASFRNRQARLFS